MKYRQSVQIKHPRRLEYAATNLTMWPKISLLKGHT